MHLCYDLRHMAGAAHYAIAVDDLDKFYGRRVGVAGLSLSVATGSLFGFLGPNGAGKSTAIRILMGLLRADAGQARIFGKDCWRAAAEIKREVGYVPGDLRLYPWLTCRHALRISQSIRRRDLMNRGMELAEAFALDPTVPVRHMSRGMRQKLGLILAMAHEPRLLILDEPSTGLDPLIQDRLFARLRGMAERGHTVFFSSHTLSEVELLCDRVAIMRDGRAVECDALSTLRAQAGRTIRLTWQNEQAAISTEIPAFLDVRKRNAHVWTAALRGSAGDFMRWCAGRPIEDVEIEPPDLAGLFRKYYTEEQRDS